MKQTAIIIIAAALAGCVTNVTTGTAKLSRPLVEKSLVKGKTTKAEVVALLGEPQSTTTSTVGTNLPGVPAETWTYTKQFYRDAMEKGAGYSFAHYAVTGSLYDRVETSVLMVMFDSRGRVSGHIFSTSAAGAAR